MNWLFIFLGFSLLIILHEGGHFLAAKATGMRVERFFLFFGPTLWSFKRGETEYGIKTIPLGGYVKITGMNPEEEVSPEHEDKAYYRQPVWRRIVVVAAGPAVNIGLAFAILFCVYLVNAQQVTQRVGEINAGTPASRSLQVGDTILAVDGKAFPSLGPTERSEAFRKQIESHKCAGTLIDRCKAETPVALRLDHKGQVKTISVRPEYDAAEGQSRLGFGYATEPANIGVGAAATRAMDSIWLVARKTGLIFSHIFESNQRKQISGIVGISNIANQTLNHSTEESLLLLALVSLSLGLINLLPILPLDGGHIFWGLVEKLRGEPVPLRVVEWATGIGITLVIALMIIGFTNDLHRLSG